MSVMRSAAAGWKPLPQPGVAIKTLRADDHPGGEEVFVTVRILESRD